MLKATGAPGPRTSMRAQRISPGDIRRRRHVGHPSTFDAAALEISACASDARRSAAGQPYSQQPSQRRGSRHGYRTAPEVTDADHRLLRGEPACPRRADSLRCCPPLQKVGRRFPGRCLHWAHTSRLWPGSNLVEDGRMNPGQVFDLALPLDQVAEATRAMDERRAIKALLMP